MQEEVTQRTVALLCGGHQALRWDVATGYEKGAGRDAERSDWPQDQAAPRQADPPAAYEAQHRRFPTSKSPTRTSGPYQVANNQDKPHKRRVRYKGTHPRTFAEKYKEHNPKNTRIQLKK